MKQLQLSGTKHEPKYARPSVDLALYVLRNTTPKGATIYLATLPLHIRRALYPSVERKIQDAGSLVP